MLLLSVTAIAAAGMLCLVKRELAHQYLPYCTAVITFFVVYILFYLFVRHNQRK